MIDSTFDALFLTALSYSQPQQTASTRTANDLSPRCSVTAQFIFLPSQHQILRDEQSSFCSFKDFTFKSLSGDQPAHSHSVRLDSRCFDSQRKRTTRRLFIISLSGFIAIAHRRQMTLKTNVEKIFLKQRPNNQISRSQAKIGGSSNNQWESSCDRALPMSRKKSLNSVKRRLCVFWEVLEWVNKRYVLN